MTLAEERYLAWQAEMDATLAQVRSRWLLMRAAVVKLRERKGEREAYRQLSSAVSSWSPEVVTDLVIASLLFDLPEKEGDDHGWHE